MLPHPSWADHTPELAAEEMAKQAGQNSVLQVKKAANEPGFFTNLGDMWKNMHPAAQNALIGGGGGALLGLGRSLYDEDERPNWLGNSLMGGLAGGALGGGGTLAWQGLQDAWGKGDKTKTDIEVGEDRYEGVPENTRERAVEAMKPSLGEQATQATKDVYQATKDTGKMIGNSVYDNPGTWAAATGGTGLLGWGAINEMRQPVATAARRLGTSSGEQLIRGAEEMLKTEGHALNDSWKKALQKIVRMNPQQAKDMMLQGSGVTGRPTAGMKWWQKPFARFSGGNFFRQLSGSFKPKATKSTMELLRRALLKGESTGAGGRVGRLFRKGGKYAIPLVALAWILSHAAGSRQRAEMMQELQKYKK